MTIFNLCNFAGKGHVKQTIVKNDQYDLYHYNMDSYPWMVALILKIVGRDLANFAVKISKDSVFFVCTLKT